MVIRSIPEGGRVVEEIVVWDNEMDYDSSFYSSLEDITETIRRVPSISSISSTSGSSLTVLPSTTDGRVARDFDTSSETSYGMGPGALHIIREQMALSLERTKQLEERVKIIPSLQAQLYLLKQEKMQLLTQIKTVENGNHIITPNLPRTSLFSITKSEIEQKPSPPNRRDCAVTCSVLTRNIGVGNQFPYMKTASTCTSEWAFNDRYSDKWLPEKAKFLDSDINFEPLKPSRLLVVKGTQTTLPREKKEFGIQTMETKEKVENTFNAHTQTLQVKKFYHSVGILAMTPMVEKGVSDDTIEQISCPKCTHEKNNLSNSLSVSLASLIGPRSKSFNLGEDKLNIAKTRTVGCQYEPFNCNKSSQYQYQIKTHTRGCQKESRMVQKAVQYEGSFATKITDTKDLQVARKHVASNTYNKLETTDTGCNTEKVSCSVCAERNEKTDREYELKKERKFLERDKKDKDESPQPSRIPRLQAAVTPTEVRKFRRQDTYTKIPSSAQEAAGLSGLNFKGDTDTSFTKLKQNFNSPEVSSHNGVFLPIETQSHSLSETTLCHPISQSQRKKKIPSKEMQGAMKVLNDSLQKGQIKNPKKSAINIVQQEWFQLSSLINANPLDVEDYLDCFEEISYDLLHYIVNMIDASGNTAMHYAVSHGNFDVVSILLDSKVCDINQPNKAGYTSVMLVSLAEVRSPTHANVVRRLFQLADVNVRAKQHGQTALMLAVSHGRIDMVQMLLEAGADINIQDEDGSTALMCAAEHGHIDIVKHFLSQRDCDSTITDVDGSTALKIAMEAGHRHIGVLLYAHERSLQSSSAIKHKRTKSSSSSPKAGSSPLLSRSSRALNDNKTNN